jgi:hypothetical protein
MGWRPEKVFVEKNDLFGKKLERAWSCGFQFAVCGGSREHRRVGAARRQGVNNLT